MNMYCTLKHHLSFNDFVIESYLKTQVVSTQLIKNTVVYSLVIILDSIRVRCIKYRTLYTLISNEALSSSRGIHSAGKRSGKSEVGPFVLTKCCNT